MCVCNGEHSLREEETTRKNGKKKRTQQILPNGSSKQCNVYFQLHYTILVVSLSGYLYLYLFVLLHFISLHFISFVFQSHYSNKMVLSVYACARVRALVVFHSQTDFPIS